MQGVNTDSTVKNLIYMYKGSLTCKSEKADFSLCRATPSGQADPAKCEPQVSSFLQCYHDMIQKSKNDCVN